jgi:hypothetical protein
MLLLHVLLLLPASTGPDLQLLTSLLGAAAAATAN